MNRDFAEMLRVLADEGVEYLIVGAYAVAGHGIPRATGDIDLWVRPTDGNADRLWRALERFGAPRSRLTPQTFTQPDVVYQIGLPPNRIDFLTSIDGVDFDEAWLERHQAEVGGLKVSMLSRRHLIVNKRATGRPQDLADVARLEESG
jgi:predicted nucleotidyltransferase